MKNLYILLLAISISTLSFGQNMDVGVSTPDGTLTLNIDYTANTAYSTPFSIWNNQVITLRWPLSAGTNVIASMASTTTLVYNADGAPVDGGDGYFYQKVISSSANQNIPFSLDETKTMVVITLVSNGADPAIDIEVLDGTNPWVMANAGGPFVNNVFGNEFDELSTPSANVLPIELTRFTVQKGIDGLSTNLDWTTASEINGSHFEIERSQDNKNWTKIGTVAAVGESSTNQEYEFLDDKLPLNARSAHKTFYYRLLMVDNDGASEYSEIRSMRFDLDGEADFLVYPNPSYNEVFVYLSSITPETGPAQLNIININGQLVKKITLATSDDIGVDISDLNGGVYNFVVRQGEQTFVQKIVKVD